MAMNPWHVEKNPLILRRVGKTGEELTELIEAALKLQKRMHRVSIQGLRGIDPDTGQDNFAEMCKELADVQAQINCCILALGVPEAPFQARVAQKMGQMAEWEAMVS
jgi:NTP pyrophosphatase (non-canonical NTP hydrolase)